MPRPEARSSAETYADMTPQTPRQSPRWPPETGYIPAALLVNHFTSLIARGFGLSDMPQIHAQPVKYSFPTKGLPGGLDTRGSPARRRMIGQQYDPIFPLSPAHFGLKP